MASGEAAPDETPVVDVAPEPPRAQERVEPAETAPIEDAARAPLCGEHRAEVPAGPGHEEHARERQQFGIQRVVGVEIVDVDLIQSAQDLDRPRRLAPEFDEQLPASTAAYPVRAASCG